MQKISKHIMTNILSKYSNNILYVFYKIYVEKMRKSDPILRNISSLFKGITLMFGIQTTQGFKIGW